MGDGSHGRRHGEKRVIGLVPTHRRLRDAGRRIFCHPRSPISFSSSPGLAVLGSRRRGICIGDPVPGPESRMIPPTSLRQMASLLERCKVVITNDNGPMHLATAVGTPTVTIYGPTDPASWKPGGLRHRVNSGHRPLVPWLQFKCLSFWA